MNEPYQTPPSLVDIEEKLSTALQDLQQNLDGVEELTGIASSFSKASEANIAVITAFKDASNSYEKSSTVTMTALEVLSNKIKENQNEFSETLNEIRNELNFQKGKMGTLKILAFMPIILVIGLIALTLLR
jgi:hypothetical protein